MEFQTKIAISRSTWKIHPCENMLFVGSCFADNIGKHFLDEKFHAIVNPYGVMYNPVSILHTIHRLFHNDEGISPEWLMPQLENVPQDWHIPHSVIITLGTNHIYILKDTGEIVDNCRKRPQMLFEEKKLSVDECVDYLRQAVKELYGMNPDMKIIFTVSPIRYRKYGYHESQLSKAVLQLAADTLVQEGNGKVDYFPAYEIMNDELRDYRFYEADMLHPSDQAVEYIYERFAEIYFGEDTLDFLRLWKPIKEALGHKPVHPDSDEYRNFMDKTMLKVSEISKKYPNFALY